MSVIFGIFNRKKKDVEHNAIQVMNNALDYWDADDRGSWKEGSIFLGHRMLWNTPESKLEHIPHTVSTDNQILVITIDARLDNRKILADQLKIPDNIIDQTTDSDLILSAYQKWGEECPKYFLGDFVFVIWDAKKEQLFCVRDHIGIKPFYYFLSDDIFIFSNDIRGVIAHPEVSKTYNERSLAMFLCGVSGFFDKKDTFFEAIQKLPAATSMTITKDSVLKSTYWDTENISEIYYDTYEEYVEKLRELLVDAVKIRLRTSYPVASHLSGGLDSSAIAVLAARELEKRDQPLYAFNWIKTPKEEYDPAYCEWGFAAQLASLENIEQKTVRLTAEYIADKYDKIDITKDDISYFWSEYLVRDEVEKYKIRTLLSGWGGDELISYNGYNTIQDFFRQGHFIKGVKDIYTHCKYTRKPSYIYLRTLKGSMKELIDLFLNKNRQGIYIPGENESNPFEFIRDPYPNSLKEYSFPPVYIDPGVHTQQKVRFTGGHILHRIENWATSAFGKKMEYSYPLLDKRIVEFALAVPEDLFALKEGHQRYFFRSAISNFLPKNIAWERKIIEPVHGKAYIDLLVKALDLWMQKNKTTPENGNSMVDRSKIIMQLKLFFEYRAKGGKDILLGPSMVAAILLSHLKDKDFALKKKETKGKVSI